MEYFCLIKIYFEPDVDLQLLHQPIAYLPAGHILPLLPCEGRVVNEEVECDSRLVYGDSRQGRCRFVGRDSLADVDVGKAGNKRDVASRCFSDFNALQSFKRKHFRRAAGACRSVRLFYKNLLIRPERSRIYTYDSKTPKKIIIGQVKRLRRSRRID